MVRHRYRWNKNNTIDSAPLMSITVNKTPSIKPLLPMPIVSDQRLALRTIPGVVTNEMPMNIRLMVMKTKLCLDMICLLILLRVFIAITVFNSATLREAYT